MSSNPSVPDHFGNEIYKYSNVLYEGKSYQVLDVGHHLVRLHQYELKDVQGNPFMTDCYWVPSDECEIIQDLQISHERDIIKA